MLYCNECGQLLGDDENCEQCEEEYRLIMGLTFAEYNRERSRFSEDSNLDSLDNWLIRHGLD